MKNSRKVKSVSVAIERTNKLFFLSVLAAGSLFLGRASHALSGNAAEESGGQSSSHEAHRGASPMTELIAGAVRTPSVADRDRGRSYSPTAGELVGAVVANELTEREKQRKWICMVEKRAGKQTLTEVQIETEEGPLYRVLAIDGAALNRDQRQQDDARIGRLMKDPRTLLQLKQAQDEDELKLEKLMSLMPACRNHSHRSGGEALGKSRGLSYQSGRLRLRAAGANRQRHSGARASGGRPSTVEDRFHQYSLLRANGDLQDNQQRAL